MAAQTIDGFRNRSRQRRSARRRLNPFGNAIHRRSCAHRQPPQHPRFSARSIAIPWQSRCAAARDRAKTRAQQSRRRLMTPPDFFSTAIPFRIQRGSYSAAAGSDSRRGRLNSHSATWFPDATPEARTRRRRPAARCLSREDQLTAPGLVRLRGVSIRIGVPMMTIGIQLSAANPSLRRARYAANGSGTLSHRNRWTQATWSPHSSGAIIEASPARKIWTRTARPNPAARTRKTGSASRLYRARKPVFDCMSVFRRSRAWRPSPRAA